MTYTEDRERLVTTAGPLTALLRLLVVLARRPRVVLADAALL